ncbi:MAG: segregation and condensation protein A [Candidatus Bathyarchaeota archaeon BA2]|nr:MAG: segregation and condensation protein A [Candidatus Bathyarchaeota archaeon BA2]
MSSSVGKPFYFQPPWNILFELHRLQKIASWDINIAFLLTSFLEEMEKRGEIDFRASGVALDSSTTIYLMKSKLLLKLEEPPPPPKTPPDFLPPPLFLPLRYELTTTTIQHLLNVLDEVLKGERLSSLKPPLETVLPPPEIFPPLDLYLMEVEERMKKLYGFLHRLATGGKIVVFSKVVAGVEKLEAVKTFIVLLFLAQRGKVNLWQEENFGELYITVMEGPTVDGKGTGII